MKYLILALLFMTAPIFAYQITIYNSNNQGFALIHDTVNLDLEKGINDYQLRNVTDQINVNSIILQTDKGIELLIQDFQPNLANTKNILQNSLNQVIKVSLTDSDPIKGKLIYFEEGILALEDLVNSSLLLIKLDKVVSVELADFQTDLDNLKPALFWQLYSPGKQVVELDYSYLTNGFNWKAIYNAVWNEDKKELLLNSQVVITNNSSKDFSDCQIKLMAGDVNLYQDRSLVDSEQALYGKGMVAMERAAMNFQEQALYDFHLYTLSQNIDLPSNKSRQIQLYPSTRIDAHKYFLYNTYDAQLYGIIAFKNSQTAGFGKPIPQGMLKLYTPEKDTGLTQFIGDIPINRAAVDEEVELQTGAAFDFKGETMELKTYKGVKNDIIAKDIRMTLWNNSDREAEINVQHYLNYLDEIYNNDFDYKRIENNRIEFTLTLAAHSEKIITWSQKK